MMSDKLREIITKILKNHGKLEALNQILDESKVSGGELNQTQVLDLLNSLRLIPNEVEVLVEFFDSNVDNIVELETPLIIGNGDAINHLDATEKSQTYGVDGVMIGRGVFKNPFAFNPDVIEDDNGNLVNIKTGQVIGLQEKLNLLLMHLDLWTETWGETKNYAALKKYFKIYINVFDGASSLRQQLMDTENIQDAKFIVQRILN